MIAILVKMPSGSRYWTVLDEAMDVVPVAEMNQHVGRAEDESVMRCCPTV
jgi:hypothetical protein